MWRPNDRACIFFEEIAGHCYLTLKKAVILFSINKAGTMIYVCGFHILSLLSIHVNKFELVIFPSSVGKVREVPIDSRNDNKGNSVVGDALRCAQS